MADKILRAKRKQFINSVSIGTINGLLDELLEKRVLNQEEMDKIKLANITAMDKARDLCDHVSKKGPRQAKSLSLTFVMKTATWQEFWSFNQLHQLKHLLLQKILKEDILHPQKQRKNRTKKMAHFQD